jgi:hypothetical protein
VTVSADSDVDHGAVVTAAGVPYRVRTRRAEVVKVDPWSVAKVSFVLSVAVAIVTVVGVLVLWSVLSAGGVFDSVDRAILDVAGQGGTTVTAFFGFGRVITLSLLLGVVDVVLVTALATLFALLYNLASGFVGGISVTLSDE